MHVWVNPAGGGCEGVGAVIHHVFKQWRGGPGCAGLMTGFRSAGSRDG